MAEVVQLEHDLAQALGAVDLFGMRGIKWSSASQVLGLMRDRGHDVERVDEDVLQRLAAEGEPLAPLLLRYRDATKRSSTYGIAYLKHVHSRTGRIHARYRQLGSQAGRMSCTDPNLQQVPTDPRYRACFRPQEGRVLVKADYSQIELRLAAEIAGDARLIQAFQRGDDLHTLTARQVLGKTASEVTSSERKAAKAINFGLLYGMGAKTLRAKIAQESGLEVSEAEARAWRDKFFATYRGLRAWHDRYREPYGQETSIDTRTVLGRRRLRVCRFTEKLNSGVQGAGCDGLKAALALLWDRRQQVPGAYPVLAVHDELVVETAEDRMQETEEWLEQCMKEGMQKVLHVVPVEVEVKHGRDWSMT
jgi:DNA polymerase-1